MSDVKLTFTTSLIIQKTTHSFEKSEFLIFIVILILTVIKLVIKIFSNPSAFSQFVSKAGLFYQIINTFNNIDSYYVIDINRFQENWKMVWTDYHQHITSLKSVDWDFQYVCSRGEVLGFRYCVRTNRPRGLIRQNHQQRVVGVRVHPNARP